MSFRKILLEIGNWKLGLFRRYLPNFRAFSRVLLLSVLIFTLAVPFSLSLAPQRAEAGTRMVVEINGNLFTNIINTVQAVLKVLKDYGLDGVAWVIAQKLIQKMAADIVKWAQRGFDGAPAFATDFEGLLLDTANAVAGDYILGIRELAWLCSPYSFNIRFTLAIQVQQFRERTPRCTITGIVERFEDFLEGDFLAGGWEGWFRLTQQPTNNIYGSFLTARGGLTSAITSAKERKINLLDWGHGFLGYQTCPPGTRKSKQGQENTCYDDLTGAPSAPITQTPGKVIEDQVNKALPEGRKKLITADEINEIIGAIAAQLISMAFESAGGLFKADSPRPGSRTSILDQLRGEKPENYQTQKQPDETQIRTDLDQQFIEEQNSFRYSLSAPAVVRARPGTTRSVAITKTLLAGIGRPTSIVVSNVSDLSAKGITFFGSNEICTPTCTLRGDVTVSATTATGTYPVIITGDPAPDGGSITMNLEVTTDPDTEPPAVLSVEVNDLGLRIGVTVNATDDIGVARVELAVDVSGNPQPPLTDTSEPFIFEVASSYPSGTIITLTAVAFDAVGQRSAPQTATYTVGGR